MAGEDFVYVRLSQAGVEYSHGGSLTLAGARFYFEFDQDSELRVTRAYDWDRVLSQETNDAGEPLFELVAEHTTEEGAN